MEIDLHPPLEVTDAAQQQRFTELSLRSFLLTQHEELAQRWQQLQLIDQASRDAAWRAREQELATAYEADVGVHPRDRARLEQQIEAAILQGSHETLSQILALVKGQSENGSSLVSA